jgi:hypothetical protein
MNSNHRTPLPAPTARCRAIAALLPLLDAPDTDAAAAAEVRAHLNGCAYCQAQRAAYRQLETAARRYLGPPAVPRYRTEDLMSDILREAPAETVSAHVHTPVTPTPIHTLPREPRRPRRVLSGLASLAAVLVIGIIAASLFYSRAHPQQTGAPVGSVASTSTTGNLLDVAMVSSNEGWAVGYNAIQDESRLPDGNFMISMHDTVLMMHYLHGKWSPVQLSFSGKLTSLSMLSATDGWAIGYLDNDATGLFLHYDGHSWKQVLNTNAPGVDGAHRLYMLSDTDGWAINYSVWHYDGHSWTAQPLPASLEDGTQHIVVMQDIAMTSATDGWAVGYLQDLTTSSQAPDAIMLRYSGGQWTVASTIKGAEIKGIVMTSPDEGWAVGRHAFPTKAASSNEVIDSTPLLLHYSRGAWSEVPDPLDTADSQHLAFEHISMLSDLDGWILIGTGVNSRKSATLSYDGTAWQVTRLPIKGLDTDGADISSISMTSSRDGWAVGSVNSPKTISIPNAQGTGTVQTVVPPLLLHYQNNAWTVYNL